MTRYQALASVTVAATLVLIAMGAVGRTTGSGLGCPDWPRCHGAWLPPMERTAIIEYSHRTAAAIVGALVVATAFLTLRLRGGPRPLRMLIGGALALLAFQAWLGKETVERELPPSVVTLHLATALLLLAALVVIAVLTFASDIPTPRRPRWQRAVIAAAVMTYFVLLTGAYVVNADATTACISWPGCSTAPIPFMDGVREHHVHWLHRLIVVLGALAVGGAAAALLRSEGEPTPRRAGWAVVILYALQILVGASNIWTDFSEASRVAHLALAAAIWAILVALSAVGRYVPLEAAARLRERGIGSAQRSIAGV
jgi:heme A synthase